MTEQVVRIWAFEDAPPELRNAPEVQEAFEYDERHPMWLSHVPTHQPPSYTLLYLCKAWIESMTDNWRGVWLMNRADGQDVRVGWEKRR